jgi:hypothetical protein
MLTQGRKPSSNPVLMQLLMLPLLLMWLMALTALLAPYSCSCTCFCPLLHFLINQQQPQRSDANAFSLVSSSSIP